MNTQIQKPCLEELENALGRFRGGVLNRESEDEQPKTFFGICGGFAKQPTSMVRACEE